jgi:hypothetical protein
MKGTWKELRSKKQAASGVVGTEIKASINLRKELEPELLLLR